MRLWRESELGRLYTAVDEYGRPCTVRVVETDRAAQVAALWARLRTLDLPDTVEVVERWGAPETGSVWAVSPGNVEATLADRVSMTGRLAAEEAASLARDLRAALEQLHAAGVVHGGVSASTIVWTGERWLLTGVGLFPIVESPGNLEEASAADDLGALDRTLAEVGPPPSPVADDDVQFTVYRPKRVHPGRWYTMLAFAHKTDEMDDPDGGTIDPVEQVRRRAAALLGTGLEGYAPATEDSSVELPRGSQLRFVPVVEGVEFNPPQRSFSWEEPVHEETFRLRAAPRLTGTRARGAVTVFLGTVIIAEVTLSMAVDAAAAADGQEPVEADRARRYDRIFVSYSHKDVAVVERVKVGAAALGHEVVLDRTHLRSGQNWSAELERLIGGADIFQLFWSRNAMASKYVRDEWTYALSLGRQGFIRPVYWEDPFPESADLPPEQLRRLHFFRLMAPAPAPAPAGHEIQEQAAQEAVSPVGPEPGPVSPVGPEPGPVSPVGPEPGPVSPGNAGPDLTDASPPAGTAAPPPPPVPPPARLPARRWSRAAAAMAGVAAALGAVVMGGLLSTDSEPPVAVEPTVRVVALTAEPPEVCQVTGRAVVRAVIEADERLADVEVRIGGPATAAVPMQRQPAAGAADGRLTYTATVGPLVSLGPAPVRLEVDGKRIPTGAGVDTSPLTVVACPPG